MEESELTTAQREVVDSIDQRLLVLGGPGSGKTTTALFAARRQIETVARPSQRVLFLTFSRTAVGQVSSRAPAVLSRIQGRVEVATFHSFAYRMLRNFGRYCGYGRGELTIQSSARERVFGSEPGMLTYNALVPGCLRLLTSDRLRALVSRRWPLIVCDEFQDTNVEQWELLNVLSGESRLILLGDVNQLIYSFIPGVSTQRFEDAHNSADAIVVLDGPSHRDPSGVIPAAADAIRERRFDHEAIRTAVEAERLCVLRGIVDPVPHIASEMARVRSNGCRSIGIFAHSNQGVAALSLALDGAGVEHTLVGIPEAHGEALLTMALLCERALGLKSTEAVHTQLAVFVTACSRGGGLSSLAQALSGRIALPPDAVAILRSAEEDLAALVDRPFGEFIDALPGYWSATVDAPEGERPWLRAAADFGAAFRAQRSTSLTSVLAEEVRRVAGLRRTDSLVETSVLPGSSVQLMNFYQTKGREADAVILVYAEGDYLANASDAEPYEKASRVLFVSMTRARKQLSVLLPEDPHPLVAPLGDFERP